jgi:hypothetical protein
MALTQCTPQNTSAGKCYFDFCFGISGGAVFACESTCSAYQLCGCSGCMCKVSSHNAVNTLRYCGNPDTDGFNDRKRSLPVTVVPAPAPAPAASDCCGSCPKVHDDGRTAKCGAIQASDWGATCNGRGRCMYSTAGVTLNCASAQCTAPTAKKGTPCSCACACTTFNAGELKTHDCYYDPTCTNSTTAPAVNNLIATDPTTAHPRSHRNHTTATTKTTTKASSRTTTDPVTHHRHHHATTSHEDDEDDDDRRGGGSFVFVVVAFGFPLLIGVVILVAIVMCECARRNRLAKKRQFLSASKNG